MEDGSKIKNNEEIRIIMSFYCEKCGEYITDNIDEVYYDLMADLILCEICVKKEMEE